MYALARQQLLELIHFVESHFLASLVVMLLQGEVNITTLSAVAVPLEQPGAALLALYFSSAATFYCWGLSE